MVQVTAWTDPDATVLRLTFPDGTVVEDDVRLADAIETPIHGRTGVGHVVDGPCAAALGAFLAGDVRLVRCDQPGGTRIAHAATLVTDGSLDALGAALGVGVVDARRFRMLIELDGGARPRGGHVDRRPDRPRRRRSCGSARRAALRDDHPRPGHRSTATSTRCTRSRSTAAWSMGRT